jgi:hypothetical protein
LRIGAVLGTIGAIVVLAASAQAATSQPPEMSQPEYRALMIRSEALNKQGFSQAGANRIGPQESAALGARSEALNRLHGLSRTSQPTKVVEQPTVTGSGFDRGYFGIGAAAMLGLVLLIGGLLAGAFFGRKIGVRPRSVS